MECSEDRKRVIVSQTSDINVGGRIRLPLPGLTVLSEPSPGKPAGGAGRPCRTEVGGDTVGYGRIKLEGDASVSGPQKLRRTAATFESSSTTPCNTSPDAICAEEFRLVQHVWPNMGPTKNLHRPDDVTSSVTFLLVCAIAAASVY